MEATRACERMEQQLVGSKAEQATVSGKGVAGVKEVVRSDKRGSWSALFLIGLICDPHFFSPEFSKCSFARKQDSLAGGAASGNAG